MAQPETVRVPTFAELRTKRQLGFEPLCPGETYVVELASFGQADGYNGGPQDEGRAFLVLRDRRNGQRFLICPRKYQAQGADSGWYYEVALDCIAIL